MGHVFFGVTVIPDTAATFTRTRPGDQRRVGTTGPRHGTHLRQRHRRDQLPPTTSNSLHDHGDRWQHVNASFTSP
jgi:hypothetical protein